LGLGPWALGLILSAATPAFAQTQPAPIPKIELDEAVKRALEQSPSIQAAATAIARAEATLGQARSLTRPFVSASINNITLDNARGFNGGVTQPQNQTAFTGDVTVPVLAASRWAQVAQARDQIEVSTLSITEAKRQLAIAVAETYLLVIISHRQVEVDERALQSARDHLDYATRRLEGGAGSRLNQARAAQVAGSDEARLEATRLILRRQQEALGLLVANDGPLDSGAEPAFEMTGIETAAAVASRSDVQVQSAVKRAAERVVKDSWKDVWPTVNASFAPSVITPGGLFQPTKTWRLAVTFSQPIYQGGLQRATNRYRETFVQQATFQLSDVELRARSEIRIAEESVRLLDRALAAARVAAERAAEVLRITTTAFEVGSLTNLEVIDAQRSARDADSAVALAEGALLRAKLDWVVAVGRFPR
jgi:outer membrane protein TolC